MRGANRSQKLWPANGSVELSAQPFAIFLAMKSRYTEPLRGKRPRISSLYRLQYCAHCGLPVTSWSMHGSSYRTLSLASSQLFGQPCMDPKRRRPERGWEHPQVTGQRKRSKPLSWQKRAWSAQAHGFSARERPRCRPVSSRTVANQEGMSAKKSPPRKVSMSLQYPASARSTSLCLESISNSWVTGNWEYCRVFSGEFTSSATACS
mmetsp:Transcript_104175/g.324881  ORF Transcript_104175/g.324881 Transcript_104175/m.324881 type:complete len:207 (+) Transcript_104175:302-922(+)